MFSLCITEILLNIFNHLSFEDVLNLRYIITDFDNLDEIIYWKSLEFRKVLISNVYLLKDEFKWINEQNSLVVLFDYLSNEPNMCIAGGYPTMQYFEKKLSDFSGSDIDIYIFNDDHKKTFKKFVEYLDNKLGINKIDYIGKSYFNKSIFNLHVNNIARIIQVIGTCDISISEILRQYDTSHNRCCLYLGSTYVSYDAQYAKKINTTYFNKNYNNYKRLNKAHKLGLKIFHKPNFIFQQQDEYVHDRKGCSLASAIKSFIPIIDWTNEYTGVTEIVPTLNNIKKMLLKDDISFNTPVIPLVLKSTNSLWYNMVLKAYMPKKYNNKLNEIILGTYTFTINASLIFHNYDAFSIKTYDLDQIKYIVETLNEVYYSYHNMNTLDYKTINNLVYKDVYDTVYTNNIVINNGCAYINNIINNIIRWNIPFMEKVKDTVFVIQPILRVGSKKKSRRPWYNGINGSYGHIKYKIITINGVDLNGDTDISLLEKVVNI
jgi:hypothetical protein